MISSKRAPYCLGCGEKYLLNEGGEVIQILCQHLGGVSKIFCMLIRGRGVKKKPKMCLHNMWKPPKHCQHWGQHLKGCLSTFCSGLNSFNFYMNSLDFIEIFGWSWCLASISDSSISAFYAKIAKAKMEAKHQDHPNFSMKSKNIYKNWNNFTQSN